MKIKRKTLKENYNENDSYFDLSIICKGLILLGVVLLISNFPIAYFVVISFLLIFFGILFLFIDTQFVKLSDFAQEVESGEFEKKILKELENN